MRRTSPAVALLLTLGAVSANPGLAAADNWNAPFPDAAGTFGATSDAVTGSSSTFVLGASATTGTSCAGCIRDGGIWCSRAWLAEKDDNVWNPAMTVSTNTVTMKTVDVTTAGMVDYGQCCLTRALRTGTGTLLTATAKARWLNKYTCAARYTNDISAGIGPGTTDGAGTTNDNDGTNKFWCSDGGNNQASAGAFVDTLSVVNNETKDPRTELFLMQCRQAITVCGGTANITAQTALGAADAARTRTLAITLMTKFEKCTFLSRSKIGAPTFKAVAPASGAGKVLATTYDLHYAEYALSPGNGAAAVDATSKLAQAHMTWDILKGRLYDVNQFDGVIENPQAWTWVNPAAATGSKRKRWFPVAIAEQEVAAQVGRNGAYTAALATYNTARTTYNAAVKPAAAKADFFATLFAPPTKTAVPTRPNMPTQPAAYAGLRQAAYPLTGYNVATVGTGAQTVAAMEFVVDGSHGGWGAFTLGLLKSTEDMQKSYGVFGWAKDTGSGATAYAAEEQSFVADWGQMCILPAAGGADVKNGSCPKATVALTTTTVEQVLVVSVWANNGAAVIFNDSSVPSGISLKFNVSKWKQNAAKWAAPAQPAAGVAPLSPAGAKMLAASTAAAAAVAAALY